MCNDAMAQNTRIAAPNRRRGFDIIKTIVQIANLLRAIAPGGFEIPVAGSGAFIVVADPQEVFRILFNLVHNAITIARQGRQMTHVTLLVERAGTTVTVRIADDGPAEVHPRQSVSLPAAVGDRRQWTSRQRTS
jgi:signal transduction histidine kinase